MSTNTTTAKDLTEQDMMSLNQIMNNSQRVSRGRYSMATARPKLDHELPTFIDTYRVRDGQIEPILSLVGDRFEQMVEAAAAVGADFAVINTSLHAQSEDSSSAFGTSTRSYRAIIGMHRADRTAVGGAFGFEISEQGGQVVERHQGDAHRILPEEKIPAGLVTALNTIVGSEGSLEQGLNALLSVTDDAVGYMAYGQGPLRAVQAPLVERGWLGTEAGSSLNIPDSLPQEEIENYIAAISVLTPDEQYDKQVKAMKAAAK